MVDSFTTDPKREATASFAGYRYQAFQSVLAWMRLGPNEPEGQGRVPTKKGVTCPLAKLPELITALQDAQAQVEAQGLVKSKAA